MTLLERWALSDQEKYEPQQCSIRLPRQTYARIRALHEMFPLVTTNKIIGDLLRCSLDQLEVQK